MQNITHNIAKFLGTLGVIALIASSAQAQTSLSLPIPEGAVQTDTLSVANTDSVIPVGIWAASTGVPTRIVSGALQRQIYKMPKSGLTEQQIIAPMIDALKLSGFDLVFSCQGLQCGGFDFHTAAPVAAPPAIFVDLRSFVAMTLRDDQGDHIFCVVSHFASDTYIQIDYMTARQFDISGASRDIALRLQSTLDRSDNPLDYPRTLEQGGAIILSDLTFDSGSAKLGDQDYASLTALADYLKTHQDSKIILIGHSDAVGSLQGNITLSQKRAASVRSRLVGDHGINPDRIVAQGVGYLAPIAPNTSDENRDKNRRVEAILDQD